MATRASLAAIAALLFLGAGIGSQRVMAGENTAAPSNTAPVTATPTGLRVMSFNLRVPVIFDLYNAWGVRKTMTAQTIRTYNPDLLGTQECLASQGKYLREQLPDYKFIGAGRNDGKESGEMCGVFYRAEKFDELDHGFFWLSDTPDKPGSKSWGTWFTRMATWVKLRDKADGTVFYFFNTHMDISERARVEGARMLRAKIAAIAGDFPAILTGDFNAGEGSAPYQLLVGQTPVTTTTVATTAPLIDTFREVHTTKAPGEGSFHAFHGGVNGDRIDWIMTTPGVAALDAGITHDHAGLKYPSDHYPVTALLQLHPTATVKAKNTTVARLAEASFTAHTPIPPLATPPAVR